MVWRAGQREDGPGLNEEVLAVIPMHPVTEDHTLLIPRHHQVPDPWGPVECCDGVLEGKKTQGAQHQVFKGSSSFPAQRFSHTDTSNSRY